MVKLAIILICCSAVLGLTAPPGLHPALQRRGPARRPSARDIDSGKRLFVAHCAHCHGIDGSGGRGPSLAQPTLLRAPDDKALFALIRDGVEGKEMPGFWQMSDKEVWQIVAFLRSLGVVPSVPLPGNALRGEQIYKGKGGCTSCHIVRGEGTGYGPELTTVGASRSPAYLRESLLSPGAAVPEGFLMVHVKTTDGKTISGQRINEDSFTIQIRAASNEFHSFRKADLVDLQKDFGKSPMPGYEKSLSRAEIDDVVAYLASLRGAR